MVFLLLVTTPNFLWEATSLLENMEFLLPFSRGGYLVSEFQFWNIYGTIGKDKLFALAQVVWEDASLRSPMTIWPPRGSTTEDASI